MGQRGFTVTEIVVSLGIVVILLTAALGGERAQRQAVASSYARLEASRAASSRLEELGDPGARLATGASSFTPLMRGALGTQRVRAVEPGLYEVEVEVVHPGEDVRVVLTTRIAREAAP